MAFTASLLQQFSLRLLELPQQVVDAASLVQSYMENIGTVTAQETWLSLVSDTIKFPESLRRF